MESVETVAIPEAARSLLRGLSNYDVEEVAAGLSEDARLTVSSRACLIGKSRVRRALLRALGSILSVHLEPVAVWMRRNLAIIEADVDCERCDRAHVRFPATLVLYFEDGLISEIRLSTYEPALVGNFAGFTLA